MVDLPPFVTRVREAVSPASSNSSNSLKNFWSSAFILNPESELGRWAGALTDTTSHFDNFQLSTYLSDIYFSIHLGCANFVLQCPLMSYNVLQCPTMSYMSNIRIILIFPIHRLRQLCPTMSKSLLWSFSYWQVVSFTSTLIVDIL